MILTYSIDINPLQGILKQFLSISRNALSLYKIALHDPVVTQSQFRDYSLQLYTGYILTL